eukprot:1434102-Prorocentrum_lima.AAC.1
MKRVRVSITCCHGSFLPTCGGTAEDAEVPCALWDSMMRNSCYTMSLKYVVNIDVLALDGGGR